MFCSYAIQSDTRLKRFFFVFSFIFVAATTGWCANDVLTYQNRDSDSAGAVSRKEAQMMQEREAYYQEKLKMQESLLYSASNNNNYSISDLQKPMMKVTIASVSALGLTVPPSFSDFVKLLKTEVVKKTSSSSKVLNVAGDPSDPSVAATST